MMSTAKAIEGSTISALTIEPVMLPGDATTSTEEIPLHIYETAGTYRVTLTVTGPGGASTSLSGTGGGG